MPAWVIAAIIGVASATWFYTKLAKMNGNAVPRNNAIAAAAAGFVLFLLVLITANLFLDF